MIKSSAQTSVLEFVTLESSVMPSPFAPKSLTQRTLLDLSRVLGDPDCGRCKRESNLCVSVVFALTNRNNIWTRPMTQVEEDEYNLRLLIVSERVRQRSQEFNNATLYFWANLNWSFFQKTRAKYNCYGSVGSVLCFRLLDTGIVIHELECEYVINWWVILRFTFLGWTDKTYTWRICIS